MIRPLTCICALLAGGAGLFLYQAKHRTLMLDRQIEQTFHRIDDTRQKIGILQAEWALLNSPERLADLADKYLSLKPVAPTQFVTLADLDQRLPPPEPAVAQAATTAENPATAQADATADSETPLPTPEHRASRTADASPAPAAAHREPRHEHDVAENRRATAAATPPARHNEDVRRHDAPERHRPTALAQRDAPRRQTRPAAVAEVAFHPRPARAESEAQLVRPAPVYAAVPRQAVVYARTPPVTGSLLGGVHAVMAPPVPVAGVR